MYKMYSCMQPVPVTEAQTTWNHRSMLLKQQIQAADCDVVCLQETAADSFETDWSFMATDLGYTKHALFKKGRFRPATFWRPERCELAYGDCGDGDTLEPQYHRDRCLVTPLRLVQQPPTSSFSSTTQEAEAEGSTEEARAKLMAKPTTTAVAYVVNCHLTAGPEGARRLRQVSDVVDFVRKYLAKRQQLASGTSAKKKILERAVLLLLPVVVLEVVRAWSSAAT